MRSLNHLGIKSKLIVMLLAAEQLFYFGHSRLGLSKRTVEPDRASVQFESVNDQLKNICQIEPSRHRSVFNFLVNLLAGLVAYTYQNKKPTLDLKFKDLRALPPAIF